MSDGLCARQQWKRQQQKQATKLSAVSAFSASSQPSSTVASSTDGSRAGDAPVGSDVAADGEAPAMPEGLSKVEQMKVRAVTML